MSKLLLRFMFIIYRPRQKAPRAGTPGFRSPEVLMRLPKQTTGDSICTFYVSSLMSFVGNKDRLFSQEKVK